MKIPILAAFALQLLSLRSFGADSPIVVANSGSPQIDRLVSSLVSRTPAPLPIGGHLPEDSPLPSAELRLLNHSGRCATDEVEAAFQKLKVIAPKDYSFLLKHSYDDRYSYSMIGPWGSPTMSGWINISVGEAIDRILSNEFDDWLLGLYKGRVSGDGNKYLPPTFTEYMDAQGGDEKWVRSVSNQSRKQIDLAYLSWCIETEEKRGFKDEESRREVLGRYIKKKAEVEQAAALNGQ